MSGHRNATADLIADLARRHRVELTATESDVLARHISRLAGDDVVLDDVEQTLMSLQRAGHLSRRELVRLQARYLRESRP
ncbi:hypothetical protein KQX63_19565 [Rhodopseudomonas palustris]|uniref:hypothetical protein n=1 Tax=Rhodopseudomonas palustris TaxID=1076 RepID=UPI0021F38D96|nr:hypothetical protein [Rhodopseudomonas palustris]UYO43560.1 hypothetical protein KQX63_19565 [Rhodopseudomonas palustris]